jgi:hypothetical protein
LTKSKVWNRPLYFRGNDCPIIRFPDVNLSIGKRNFNASNESWSYASVSYFDETLIRLRGVNKYIKMRSDGYDRVPSRQVTLPQGYAERAQSYYSRRERYPITHEHIGQD